MHRLLCRTQEDDKYGEKDGKQAISYWLDCVVQMSPFIKSLDGTGRSSTLTTVVDQIIRTAANV